MTQLYTEIHKILGTGDINVFTKSFEIDNMQTDDINDCLNDVKLKCSPQNINILGNQLHRLRNTYEFDIKRKKKEIRITFPEKYFIFKKTLVLNICADIDMMKVSIPVNIIKPFFDNDLNGEIKSSKLFWGKFWNPAWGLFDTIDFIIKIVNKYGVICKKKKNIYVNMNDLLCQVLRISEIDKRCSDTFFDLNKKIKMTCGKKNSGDAKYWKEGTGYGHEGLREWDVKNYLDKNSEKEKNIDKVITLLSETIRLIKKTNEEIMQMLLKSNILPLIDNYLRGTSLSDLSTKGTYLTIITFIISLLGSPFLKILIYPTYEKGTTNIWNLCNIIVDDCVVYLNNLMTVCVTDKNIILNFQKEINICSLIIDLTEQMFDHLSQFEKIDEKKEIVIPVENKCTISDKYCLEMKKEHTVFCTIARPSFEMMIKTLNITLTNSSTSAIMKDISVISKSLPLTYDSSIFFRVDESSMNFMQFLITCPQDTPYSGGCLLFNMFIPNDYPNNPPKVNISTTGGGVIAFSPNLYASGHICLSLLGTWKSGKGSEIWIPKVSTLLQIMVSIQSLLLTAEPYFNEPGREDMMTTPEGKASSKSYNDNLHLRIMQFGMTDMLVNPPKGFDNVVKTHFKYHKDDVIKRCEKWMVDFAGDKKLFAEELTKLKNALSKNI